MVKRKLRQAKTSAKQTESDEVELVPSRRQSQEIYFKKSQEKFASCEKPLIIPNLKNS